MKRTLPALLSLALISGTVTVSDLAPDAVAAGSRDKRKIKKFKKQNRALKGTIALLQQQLTSARQPTIPPPDPVPFIEMVPIGHVGNPADSTTYGAVNYEFQIGKYEVSLDEYTVFLNAVAATDTHSLYHASLGTNHAILGIERSGSDGSYTYSVIGSGQRPVTYVTWLDAARFCNWLHNGRPTGAQDASTTERGAYTLDGAMTDTGVTRNPGAKYWLPNENEWYKAAYHQPESEGGPVGDYWDYPTKREMPNAPGNLIGAAENQANILNHIDNKYSVTQAAFEPMQNYLTDGGTYAGSGSFYGTFDQGGNLTEWNEERGLRGGAWNYDEYGLRANINFNGTLQSDEEGSDVGFRIASP